VRRRAHGTSLVEASVFLLVGLIVMGLTATLHARFVKHDTWTGARLSALESVLATWERLRNDLACSATGRVGFTDAAFEVERATSPAGDRSETVHYERDTTKSVRRSGRPLAGAHLDALGFGWASEKTSVLMVNLAAGGDHVAAAVHVVGRARRAEFASWVEQPDR
jgi:hypothetical protein